METKDRHTFIGAIELQYPDLIVTTEQLDEKQTMRSLDTEAYINLETVRRNGTPVITPVWFALYDGGYYVFSAREAGKVKRLKHTPSVRIAACTMKGKTIGEWLNTSAALIDSTAPDIKPAYKALEDKYGWQLKITNFFSRLTGKMKKRQMIRIEVP